MPLGESAYEGKQKSTFVHPECMAQAGWNFLLLYRLYKSFVTGGKTRGNKRCHVVVAGR